MFDFIPDGYTRTVGFDQQPGTHRRFHFSYRPFGGPQRSKALAVCDGDVNKSVAMVLDRVSAWSFSEPIDEARLNAMPSPAYDKIYLTLLGLREPDFELVDGREVRTTLTGEQQAADDEKN